MLLLLLLFLLLLLPLPPLLLLLLATICRAAPRFKRVDAVTQCRPRSFFCRRANSRTCAAPGTIVAIVAIQLSSVVVFSR